MAESHPRPDVDRVELPVGKRLLRGPHGKGPDLGDMVAEADRALAEIVLDQRMAEGMAVKVERRARTRANSVEHFV